MTRRVGLRLRLIAAVVLATAAAAALSVGTVLAGSGGPPFPR